MKAEQEQGEGRLEGENRVKAIRHMGCRMNWRPDHPIEKEIYQIALQRIEQCLRKKNEENLKPHGTHR